MQPHQSHQPPSQIIDPPPLPHTHFERTQSGVGVHAAGQSREVQALAAAATTADPHSPSLKQRQHTIDADFRTVCGCQHACANRNSDTNCATSSPPSVNTKNSKNNFSPVHVKKKELEPKPKSTILRLVFSQFTIQQSAEVVDDLLG
jgi:hypothetical protein